MESHSILISITDLLSYVFLFINPQGTTFLAVTLIVLLLLTFTISGAEVALFSLNKKDVNMLKTKQHASAKRIVILLEEPRRPQRRSKRLTSRDSPSKPAPPRRTTSRSPGSRAWKTKRTPTGRRERVPRRARTPAPLPRPRPSPRRLPSACPRRPGTGSCWPSASPSSCCWRGSGPGSGSRCSRCCYRHFSRWRC